MQDQLQKILSVPEEQRDQNWENQFFVEFTKSNVQVLSAEPQYGPDGWPYLMVATGPEADEPAQRVIQWLAEKGIGLCVNPVKEYPDYVFSFGMLWSFTNTGYFYRPIQNSGLQTVEFSPASIVHAGAPSSEYLPEAAKQILRDFFRDQNILAPKILLLSTDRLNYDLAFSLESLGNPPEAEHAGIAEAIGWFLPPHYSILLVSEKGLPEFASL